ncbi:MAG: urease [Planctomycetota bacterium]|nr:MAG: urease [Planctomycetota bacterium]
MLEIRPTCENCNKFLPPSSTDAMICSYECTFCSNCVAKIIENVCPNCGGGFCQRPVRPIENLKGGNYLGIDPASTVIIHKPVDKVVHNAFAEKIKYIASYER